MDSAPHGTDDIVYTHEGELPTDQVETTVEECVCIARCITPEDAVNCPRCVDDLTACGGLSLPEEGEEPVPPPELDCGCIILCTDTQVSDSCLACLFASLEERPVAEVCKGEPLPVCDCTTVCVDADSAPDCPLCSLDHTMCAVIEAPVCTCVKFCDPLSTDILCLVCTQDSGQRAPPEIICICYIDGFKCENGLIGCPACLEALFAGRLDTFCTGTETRACDCETRCLYGSYIKEDCSVCIVNAERCEIPADAPCICAYKCTDELIGDCYTCKTALFASAVCQGTKERVCICENACALAGNGVDLVGRRDCSVCSITKDATKCVAHNCTCVKDPFGCSRTNVNRDCVACALRYTNCKYQCTCGKDRTTTLSWIGYACLQRSVGQLEPT